MICHPRLIKLQYRYLQSVPSKAKSSQALLDPYARRPNLGHTRSSIHSRLERVTVVIALQLHVLERRLPFAYIGTCGKIESEKEEWIQKPKPPTPPPDFEHVPMVIKIVARCGGAHDQA